MGPLVAVLLKFFPARFRRRFGADLLATFEDRWREGADWRLALRTTVDLIRAAFLEHLSEIHPARKPARKGDTLIMALWQDLRFAIRTLAKTPGFTAVALVTLALGIGANSAIYSVVNAVLLKGLPYPNAGRLVFLNESLPKAPFLNVAWPDFLDWRAQNQVFSEMAAFQPNSINFNGGQEPKPVKVGWVSSSFFSLLGAKPAMGRTFGERDDRPGAAHGGVLSYTC
jgi:hypothetical protein